MAEVFLILILGHFTPYIMRATKKINLIRENLKKNPEGITLNFKGEVVNKKKGFYVSISNISGRRLNYLINKTLFIRKTAFKETKNLFMGGWFDGKKYFLDLSLFVEEEERALYLGKLFNQQAIFNINKSECVSL